MKNELLLKVKALAEKGIGGEKENAEILLQKLMAKYNVNLEDLDEDVVAKREFERPKEFNWLFVQVCASVIGKGAVHYSYKAKNMDKKWCLVECTSMQSIEIKALFDFYLQRFKDDFDIFKHAFVINNDLFAHDYVKEEIDCSQKELEAALKARRLAMSLERHEYHKQLNHAH